MRVYNVQRQARDAGCELSALVDGIPGQRPGFRVWFRFNGLTCEQVTADADPFLAGLLPFAMLAQKPLEFEDPVSERLLSGIPQIMSIWRRWESGLNAIVIRALATRRPGPRASGIGCFFTCGVDSFYSLLKNRNMEEGDSRVTHLVFLQGHADTSLQNEILFRLRQDHIDSVASELSLKVVYGATNLRDVIPGRVVPWAIHSGPMLAAAALCLAPLVRRVIISSGHTYDDLYPWGVHPITDPLWSTELVELAHDGAEAGRALKIERYIQHSAIALRHLRVCSDGWTSEYNCGRCEKCVRTAITLRILGVRSPALPLEVSLEAVQSLNGSNSVISRFIKDNLALIERGRSDPGLAVALRKVLRPNPLRWVRTRLERLVFLVDQRVFQGRLWRWAHAQAQARGEFRRLKTNPTSWLLGQIVARSGRRDAAGS